jgi:hypothetical protein
MMIIDTGFGYQSIAGRAMSFHPGESEVYADERNYYVYERDLPTLQDGKELSEKQWL